MAFKGKFWQKYGYVLRNVSGRCKYFVVPESKGLLLSINGINIPFVKSSKYLVANFNNLLRFNNQSRTSIKKARGVKIFFEKCLAAVICRKIQNY